MKTFTKGAPKPEKTPEEIAAIAAAKESVKAASAAAAASRSTPSKQTGEYQALEYEELDSSVAFQEPFALAIYGGFGAGKTRLGAQAPGTVGVVPLNRKTLQTALKTAQEFGKKIIKPSFDLIRSSDPIRASLLKPDCEHSLVVDIYRDQPWCCAKHNGRWAADRTKQAAFDLYRNPNTDSILVDGFDVFCEDLLIALYGRSERIQPRDRGVYNKEIIEFLAALSGKHLVLTMGEKQVWKNEKPTNDYDWAGWTHLGYHVNTVVRLTVDDKYDPESAKSVDAGRWRLTVIASQANPLLMGAAGENLLLDEGITFPALACSVYPGTEAEDWQ